MKQYQDSYKTERPKRIVTEGRTDKRADRYTNIRSDGRKDGRRSEMPLKVRCNLLAKINIASTRV